MSRSENKINFLGENTLSVEQDLTLVLKCRLFECTKFTCVHAHVKTNELSRDVVACTQTDSQKLQPLSLTTDN